VGNGPTWTHAPWYDRSWEIWSHTSTKTLALRADRYFDLHPKSFWIHGKNWDREYVKWLQRNPVPILMQKKYNDVPASVAYPKERILAEFRRYFTSQTAWMIALALTEGVTHLGLFGIHYAHYSEYATQRAGAEYWLGMAEGRGVQLVIPESNPILKTPGRLYGYESHDEGSLHEEYKYQPAPKVPEAPQLVAVFDPNNKPDNLPPLRELDEPVAWERSGYAVPELETV
jgi:hypothetical protein